VARAADLAIYFRPRGSRVAGHSQPADIGMLADTAVHGRLPDFPPGWYVDIRDRKVSRAAEDSGLREDDPAWKRRYSCIESRSTIALVTP